MPSLPCIATVRPLAENCPSLTRLKGDYLYPLIMKELLGQGVCSEVLLSIAPDTPKEFIAIIASWGLPYEVGHVSLPNERLAASARARGWDPVLCISAYTLFFDAPYIRSKADQVLSGAHDYAGAENALSNMEFTVANGECLRFMQKVKRTLVPSKPGAIQRCAPEGLRGGCTRDAYSPTEEFLWTMQYAGNIANMPMDFITGFYEKHTPDEWFRRESREKHTAEYFQVDTIHALDAMLTRDFFPHISLERLTGQLRWIERCLPEFPTSGDTALELGYGDLPLISSFLCSRFRNAIALEPSFETPPPCPDMPLLFSKLASIAPYLNAPVPARMDQTLRLSNSYLEDLELHDESIDFCISKMVFEHVQDVASTSRELFRILRPGGCMLHEIGLNDHTGGTSSGIHFEFLQQSREQWTSTWKGTNLYRLNDFMELWEELGFEVEIVSKVVSSNLPTSIDKSWFSYSLEDLLCQTAILKATKPARRLTR